MREKANEAIGKVVGKIMPLVARLSKGKTTDVVIDHELPGVTPEMLSWWWLNMGDTERYKLWHPEDHISARWEVSPEEDPFRATQVACEKIGGIPAVLRIRVENPDQILETRTYMHAMGGCVLDDRDNPIISVVHEYESTPDGLLKMRSTFRVPARAPRPLKKAIRKHNREEMAQFPVFLPQLYERSIQNTS